MLVGPSSAAVVRVGVAALVNECLENKKRTVEEI